MMTRSHVLTLAAAAFSLFAVNVYAQQPATGSTAGSGTVATSPATANPEANPVVPGDRSTISGDKAATKDQKTGQE